MFLTTPVGENAFNIANLPFKIDEKNTLLYQVSCSPDGINAILSPVQVFQAALGSLPPALVPLTPEASALFGTAKPAEGTSANVDITGKTYKVSEHFSAKIVPVTKSAALAVGTITATPFEFVFWSSSQAQKQITYVIVTYSINGATQAHAVMKRVGKYI